MATASTEHRRRSSSRSWFGAWLAAPAALVPWVVTGAEWTAEPRVETSAIYSDNVNLSADGAQSGDAVGVLTPSLSLRRTDDVLDLALDYQLQAVGYLNTSGADQIFQQIDSRLGASLKQNRIQVQLYGNVAQQVADPENPLIQNNIVQTGNRTDVLTVGASLSWRELIGEAAVVELRQSVNRQQFELEQLFDSTLYATQLSLASAPREYGLTWRAATDLQTVDYGDAAPLTRISSATAELGYWLTSRLRVFGNGGLESNIFENRSSITYEEPFYFVGAELTTNRDTLALSVGQRYFGGTVNASWTHRFTEQLGFSVNYSESPSLNPQASLQFQQFLNQLINIIGGIDVDDLQSVGLDAPGRADTFIQRQLNVAVNGRLNRLSYTLRAYRVTRQDRRIPGEGAAQDQEAYGAGGQISWEAGNNTTLSATANWETGDFGGGAETDRLRAGVGADYRLGTRTDVSLRYDRFDGNATLGGFAENRVTLTLGRRFD